MQGTIRNYPCNGVLFLYILNKSPDSATLSFYLIIWHVYFKLNQWPHKLDITLQAPCRLGPPTEEVRN